MPNSGMLDHKAYSRRYNIHWMNSWPVKATGYQTFRFSRHLYNKVNIIQKEYPSSKDCRPASALTVLNNSINPFHTARIKPTCGFFYSENTDHRRFKIGIYPSNVTEWRSVYTTRPTRAQTAR